MRGPAEIHVTYKVKSETSDEELIFTESIYLTELLEFMINQTTLKTLLHEDPAL